MSLDFEGKVAIVTGSGGGIGKGYALELAQRGAKVVVNDLGGAVDGSGGSVSAAEAVVQEIEAAGGEAIANGANVCSEDDVKTMVEDVMTKWGRVDILVNNAGITRDNLAMRMKDEEWGDVLAVNMTATMMLCRSALRTMMKARWGRIISVSSIVGVTGNAGQTNYAASKAGMIGYSKSLAAEVASRGITVNLVAPGFIETPMTDVLADEQKAKLLTNVPAGRLGQGAEIAAAVAYLASEEAGYTTGATMHVNGGMAMI